MDAWWWGIEPPLSLRLRSYTIYCPGWLMEMLARFVRNGRVLVFGKPRRRWHFVSLQDFARMVVEGYRRSEAVSKRFYVHGPETLTLPRPTPS